MNWKIIFAAFFILGYVYQNCARFGAFQAMDFSSTGLSTGENDMNHPGFTLIEPPTQKIQVGNRKYVAELVREIFTGPRGPVPNLEELINIWIYYRGGQFGLGCNSYDSYSAADCAGAFSNSNLPLNVDANTVRESFRIQFCQRVLAMNESVEVVLEKIEGRYAGAPTLSSMAEIYGLFYRGDPAPENVINSLADFDRALAAHGEPPLERWRGLILQVCESPGWQLL